MNNGKTLSLYVHIPLCVRKCNYCDFLSFPVGRGGSREGIKRYLKALEAEIESLSEDRTEIGEGFQVNINNQVKSIYIGGGTPNMLRSEEIAEILCKLHRAFDIRPNAEITMEANPGIYTSGEALSEFSALKAMGINRLSIGLQSANDDELKRLGRIHSLKDFEETYESACRAGFDNINIDLISSLPGQTFDSFAHTLEKAAAYESAHISVYSLIIEEGTPFGEVDIKLLNLPDEDEDYRMYVHTRDFLRDRGYERYEISNYARPGRQCVHNRVYWEREDYLGLGPGAASFVDGVRFSNTRDMEEYLSAPGDCRRDVHVLSKREAMEEFFFLGLRQTAGVSLKHFKESFGMDADEIYAEVIKRHVSAGLMEKEGDRLRLTERGMDLANTVMADFLVVESDFYC